MTSSATVQAGLAVRQAVLGEEYVQQAIQKTTAFNAPLQELINEYCWGTVWTRPGLALRERSLINLAMLASLNRPHELRLHLVGAVNNGCTPADIQEVILQIAIYAGLPAAIEAARTAESVFEEHGIDVGPAPESA